MSDGNSTRLNGICPYFTMFPLDFPLRVLSGRAVPFDWVLDPFAGRGTTNYAARLLGLPSVGIDSNPVAVALTEAKLANSSPADIIQCASTILENSDEPQVPEGEFWLRAFHPEVLRAVCKLRNALLFDCRSNARRALRGVLLGALHGPRTKIGASYFSNQCTRTYAPKPGYAVKYWRSKGLEPPRVDVLEVIRVRAERYYAGQRLAIGLAINGDSRAATTFRSVERASVEWIITSPPFYGMRTYIPDQWLRNWLTGGPSDVSYTNDGQLNHTSPAKFSDELRSVWQNLAGVAKPTAKLVIRFGGINDRKADPLMILKESFSGSPWRLMTIRSAGSAEAGKRQAVHFSTTTRAARTEYDAWARLT